MEEFWVVATNLGTKQKLQDDYWIGQATPLSSWLMPGPWENTS